MHAEIYPWETALLSLAYEAHQSHAHGDEIKLDAPQLEEAYALCNGLTLANSRSFHMASALLPQEKRKAVRALYAFCRVTDDIVDNADSEDGGLAALEAWRQRTMLGSPPADDLVAVAWADARHAEQLLDGVARDTVQTRYSTFDDLAAYSYGVASTVGLMSMHIIGYQGAEAIPYAIKLGVALQLTNILRDVGEDWRRGRVYLPQEELAAFGIHEEEIGEGKISPRWRDFMRFQIARNRRLYDEAHDGIALLNADGRFAIGAAAGLYRGILTNIERHNYDNLSRRAYVNAGRKVGMLPGIWFRSRFVNQQSHH
jgi:phytoene synthase